MSYLGQDDIAPATFNIRRKYLKAFFSWLVDEGAYTGNPVEGIRARKAEPRIVQHSAETLANLLKLPDKSTYCGRRDYALICLSIDTAIRPSEALALTVDDVNLKEMTVLVRASIAKTRKSRTLPFSIETAKAIQGLITARPREWETPLLFANYEEMCIRDRISSLPVFPVGVNEQNPAFHMFRFVFVDDNYASRNAYVIKQLWR